MSKLDLSQLLDQRCYALDFNERLNSIEDFLALSEHTLDWQLRVEHQRIRNLDYAKLPENYPDRTLLMEYAKERFTITLPTFLRHTALMAFTSAVEIAAIDLKEMIKSNDFLLGATELLAD
jgi:hypothetical protein